LVEKKKKKKKMAPGGGVKIIILKMGEKISPTKSKKKKKKKKHAPTWPDQLDFENADSHGRIRVRMRGIGLVGHAQQLCIAGGRRLAPERRGQLWEQVGQKLCCALTWERKQQ